MTIKEELENDRRLYPQESDRNKINIMDFAPKVQQRKILKRKKQRMVRQIEEHSDDKISAGHSYLKEPGHGFPNLQLEQSNFDMTENSIKFIATPRYQIQLKKLNDQSFDESLHSYGTLDSPLINDAKPRSKSFKVVKIQQSPRFSSSHSVH